ncbi:MAG: fimbrial protein FimV [Methylomonas sp.]|nr:fimbrial protein FimV [Methylomonas sp.]
MKHLTKTLAVVSLLVPIPAKPLGIGDIALHSALNQKLNAEIHLHLAPGENPSDISVRLAPPEKFDKAGVPWSYFLSKIKFKTVELADGSVLIKVTSNEAVSEPALNFLMEVIWPQGSQFREFTVLLDPPEGYHPPAIPSIAPPTYQIEPIDEYEKPARKPRTSKRRVAKTEVASHIGPQTPTSGEYGPVRQSDTLWAIAKQLGNERGVPLNQMMNALFRANPDAFNRGDINALKAGVNLNIPETDAILQAGKAVGEPKTAPKETPPSKALELVAPVDTKVTDSAKIDEHVKPGTGIEGAPGTGKDIELQDRIDRLEQQLNMMQQLMALKDQQLAALQSKDVEAAQKAADTAKTIEAEQVPGPEAVEQQAITPTTPVQPAPEVPPTPVPAPTPTPAPVPPSPPKPVPVSVPAKQEDSGLFSSPAYYLTFGGLGAGMLGMLGWLWWRKQKIEEETITDSMFASASQIRLPDADSLSVPVMDVGGSGAYDVGTVGESSFISDFTPSDFEAFDTDQSEIDPMSEADVYLAYGRYQQAEDLIRHAISEHPDKDDFKLKLLEIYYANEDKDRFAAYAQELVDAGKNADRPFWTKVSDMGKEIVPESTLFGGAPAAKREMPVPPPPKSPAIELEENLAFETEAFDQEPLDLEAPRLPDLDLMDEVDAELTQFHQAASEEAETDNSSLDFDLSSFSQKTDSPKTDSNAALADIESIDFDLGKHQAETPPAQDNEQNINETLESFDFNFDLEDEKPSEDSLAFEAIKTPKADALDTESLESFDFSDFQSAEAEDKASASIKQPDFTGSGASDEFEFNFDFEAPSSKHGDEEIDLGVSDLTDMDEYETKIDLAKAYIDMGDAEAAKSIAEEVLEKGNQEQKQAAQAILDELA